MESLKSDLEEHFCSNVLAAAYRLQSCSSDPSPPMALFSADEFGKEFLQCIEGLPAPRVIFPFSIICSSISSIIFRLLHFSVQS